MPVPFLAAASIIIYIYLNKWKIHIHILAYNGLKKQIYIEMYMNRDNKIEYKMGKSEWDTPHNVKKNGNDNYINNKNNKLEPSDWNKINKDKMGFTCV